MKKRISIVLLMLAFMLSVYLCVAVTAGASSTFANTENWTNNVLVGTSQTAGEGISFSSQEGTKFYSNENDKSMYFFQTYSEKLVWGEMHYSLRIDEMTSATGVVALMFDFDGTMPNNPLVYLDKNGEEKLAKGQTMMLVIRKGAAEGDYTLTIVHCADNAFWMDKENGNFSSEKYSVNAENGIFEFTCEAAYDIICNGTRIQAQPYFQPGQLNITATEASEVVVSVIGFDSTAKNYDESLAITVSEGELAETLPAPAVSVEETDEVFIVSWETVANASSYSLYLYDAEGNPVDGYNGIAFTSGGSIAKSALQSGSYTVRVSAVGDGTAYLTSGLSEPVPLLLDVVAQKLDAPVISVQERAFEYTVQWEAVSHASGYKCYLYNEEGTVINAYNGIAFESGDGINKAALAAGSYSVKVVAVGDGATYLDSDQSAAAAFTYEIPSGWQKETETGSMAQTEDGLQFSSGEGTYFYGDWKDWYSLYFIYGNADAMTWGDVDLYLRIDELTSATGVVAVAFDFARTGIYNPQNIHHGANADFDSPGNTMVFSFIKTETEGTYTFYVAHQSANAGLFKIGQNGNMGVDKGTVVATDGVIHFRASASSAYDVTVNGVNYQVEDVFKPGAGNIDNAALTDKVFMSVLGYDYSDNVYDKSIVCTLLDEAPAPEEEGDWRSNNAFGSITETDVNTVTVSGKESSETLDVHTDGGRQMFPDETDRVLFSFTQTIAKKYAEMELDLSLGEVVNDSSKIMLVVNLSDSVPESIVSAHGLAIVVVPDETDGQYNVYVYRIIDRIVWEEPRETFDVASAEGEFSFTLGGNSVIIFADNQEYSVDISGLITLAGYNLDLTKNAYISVVGLDDVNATAENLSATVDINEAGDDLYVEDALDATVTGKYEFTSTDWASWEMAGTDVSYTITENGLRLEGSGGDYGQKQAQSYLYDLKQQITGEDGSLKIGLKIENFYPYVTDEETGVLIKNTFDIILGTSYQTNFTSCRSLFIRLNFKSATEGTASLIHNTGTTEQTVAGWGGDISFTWSQDEQIIIYLVKDADGNYRAYVNGVKFTMSKLQAVEMKTLIESMPEIYLSTYSTIEIEQDPNDVLKGDDSAYVSVYSIYSLNGNKVVNEAAELTNVSAPSKPEDADIGKNNIKISWEAPVLNPFDQGSFTVGGYIVERYDLNSKGSDKNGVPDAVYYITDTSELSLDVTGLTEATKYFFTIYAVEDASGGDAGRDDMVVLAKYAQFTVTTDGEPAQTEDPGTETDNKTGCSGSIATSGLFGGMLLLGAVAVLVRKNKQI